MTKVALFTVATLFIFGFSGNGFGYEGGTKMVATMTHSEEGRMASGPLLVVPYRELALGGSKLIVSYLQRLPEPTLSAQRIRGERPGPSLGTKIQVRYQKTGRV